MRPDRLKQEGAAGEPCPPALVAQIRAIVVEAFGEDLAKYPDQETTFTMTLVEQALKQFREFIAKKKDSNMPVNIEQWLKELSSASQTSFDLENFLPLDLRFKTKTLDPIYKKISEKLYKSGDFKSYLQSLVATA